MRRFSHTCVLRVCARSRIRRYRPNGSGSVQKCILCSVAMGRQQCTVARVSCWMLPLPNGPYFRRTQPQRAPNDHGTRAATHHPRNRMSGYKWLLVTELLPSCVPIKRKLSRKCATRIVYTRFSVTAFVSTILLLRFGETTENCFLLNFAGARSLLTNWKNKRMAFSSLGNR